MLVYQKNFRPKVHILGPKIGRISDKIEILSTHISSVGNLQRHCVGKLQLPACPSGVAKGEGGSPPNGRAEKKLK